MSGCYPSNAGLSCESHQENGSGNYCEHGRFSLTCEMCFMIHLINKIEEHKIRQIDENRKISARVEDIEAAIYKIEHSQKDHDHKIPHKCPVCEGRGIVATGLKIEEVYGTDLKTSKDCKSCEGKGILWG